ncbi:MAG TPA: multicopper oxidase family protein [Microlunatus sp.]|nr:multicopper oxidase family protein [Microlunatus sp.]
MLPLLAALIVVAPLGWWWQGSRVPETFSVMQMGYADLGGGPAAAHPDHGSGHGGHPGPGGNAAPRSVPELIADPRRPADIRVDLVARQERIRIGGRELDGFTLNGATPGPELRAELGQLVEVHLRNDSIAAGVTLHWHGLDVPNAMDGVAGVTQDAVPVGGGFVYRFVADRVGSYWYHAHQVSNPQVAGGLFGSLVVTPRSGIPDLDLTALAHTYAGVRTINGAAGDLRVTAALGRRARIRITNTDNAPMVVWTNTPYRVLAADGTDLHRPTDVSDRSLSLAAGARADLQVTVPSDGRAARIQLSKGTALIVGPSGAAASAPPQPPAEVDLLSYGSPAPIGFDPASSDRHFDYAIGRRLGFVRGRPGMWWSINSRLYPNVPMFVVRDGDVVTMSLVNNSGEVHPMHLHGHRLLVLARDGRPSTGSPWWVDSLDLRPRESYEVAFVADNPGLWMDHCHNLKHAADGMVAHLAYDGVDTPYRIGGSSDNAPE